MNVSESLRKNGGLKLLALSLAIVLWLFVNYDRETEREVMVPVKVANVTPGLVATGDIPSHLNVRVGGRRIEVMWLDTDRLSAILDVRNVGEGTVTFSELARTVHLGRTLRVTRVYPATVTLKLQKQNN